MKIPKLETKRLILKGLELSDAEAYETNFVDYEVIRFLSDKVPWPYPAGGVADFLENVILPKQGLTRWTWGIFLKEDPEEVVGVVDLWREGCPEHRGFWLAKRFWGQGLMSEATTATTSYAFEELGFQKLVFSNAVGNLASRRVKEKSGARLMEVRPAGFVDSAFTEAETWELTSDQWWANHRPSFVGNYVDFLEPDDAHYPGSDEILSFGAPMGRLLGLKKVGIHIETLLPGRRTSWPHAESDEEEFAHVISGNPHVWIDGHLHALVPGDFVAFPAGTGIAHTFINDSDEAVVLLVGGEATKKGNQIHYPMNPERNAELAARGMHWTDAPVRPLGPHDGKPSKN
jgi:ribosomal-protein-alanine N-acetyltransferase